MIFQKDWAQRNKMEWYGQSFLEIIEIKHIPNNQFESSKPKKPHGNEKLKQLKRGSSSSCAFFFFLPCIDFQTWLQDISSLLMRASKNY
jgi:hypothetical protein